MGIDRHLVWVLCSHIMLGGGRSKTIVQFMEALAGTLKHLDVSWNSFKNTDAVS